jgi:transposase
MAGIWDLIMEALAETHDGFVQMIDTSIVRVHQHGGCAAGGETTQMGRSRGGLTTKIHACVDTNGMPVRLARTTGEAHDNRLVTELLSDLKSGAMMLADRGYDADWIRAFAVEHGAWANIPPKRNRKNTQFVSAHICTGRAIWWSASSTGSSNAGASLPDMTNSPRTTLPSSSSQPFGFGYALMSPRPRWQTHGDVSSGSCVTSNAGPNGAA